MQIALLDPYRPRSSPVHHLDARTKLLVTVAFVLAVNLTSGVAWPAYALYGALVLAINLAAKIAPQHALKRSLVAAPFVLMAALAVPFVEEGTELVGVAVLGQRLTITREGLTAMATILVRSWLSVLMAVTLALTTPFYHVIEAMRGLGVPRILTAIIAMMYRYMHILVDEAQRLLRAREARSATIEGVASGGSLRWRAGVTGSMIGTLFIRTYERSERVYQAMLARGYRGELRTLGASRLARRDRVTVVVSLLGLTTVVVLSFLMW